MRTPTCWSRKGSGSQSNQESTSAGRGQLLACLEGDTLERLHQIKVPTLITCSDRDLIVDPHHAKEIHERIEGSKLIIMEGTGHVALIERADLFARICHEFLTSLPSA